MTGKRIQTSPTPSPGNISDGFSSKDQDRFLPIANVIRIMKKSLPANAKISKEAKETVQECVSEFISFITSEASDKCQREKRKTINGDDLLWAMTTLGFETYVGTLKIYLNKYRETEGDNINSIVSSSPTNSTSTTTITNPGIEEIGKKIAISTPTRPVHSQGFNDAYFPIGPQATPKNYQDHGLIIGYGESLIAGATRPVTTHVHQGAEW